MLNFLQKIIWDFGRRAFGQMDMDTTSIRVERLLEEAVEVAHSTGMGREKLHKIIDMVYEKPPGDLYFELGDVFITWSALCSNRGLKLQELVESNLHRVMSRDVGELREAAALKRKRLE